MYNNAAHTAQRAFVTHLSWTREEGKTSINKHKPAVYNGSHTGGVHAACSHNDTTGGTEPCWLNTFGYSFMATLRFRCDVVEHKSMKKIQAELQSSQILVCREAMRLSSLLRQG